MTEQMQVILILAGLVVIAGLGSVIYRLLQEEKRVKAERQAAEAELHRLADEQRAHLVDSIRIITRAMQSEQCGLTEGCIRLRMLLDKLAPALLRDEAYAVIETMYQATSHMPILEEWKKLKLRQRVAFTKEREALEAQHRESILQAAGALEQYDFQR